MTTTTNPITTLPTPRSPSPTATRWYHWSRPLYPHTIFSTPHHHSTLQLPIPRTLSPPLGPPHSPPSLPTPTTTTANTTTPAATSPYHHTITTITTIHTFRSTPLANPPHPPTLPCLPPMQCCYPLPSLEIVPGSRTRKGPSEIRVLLWGGVAWEVPHGPRVSTIKGSP